MATRRPKRETKKPANVSAKEDEAPPTRFQEVVGILVQLGAMWVLSMLIQHALKYYGIGQPENLPQED